MIIKKYTKKMKVLWIMIGVIFIPILYFSLNIYNVFYPTSLMEVLDDNIVTSNMIEKDSIYMSTSNDPSITVNYIDANVQNFEVNVYIENTNKNMISQIYFDYGEGMKEENSKLIKFKNGNNIVKLHGYRYLKALRIDPVDQSDIKFMIDIKYLNKIYFDTDSLIVLPLFFVLLLTLLRSTHHFPFQLSIGLILFYQCYSFIYQCDNFLLNILFILFSWLCLKFIYLLGQERSGLC